MIIFAIFLILACCDTLSGQSRAQLGASFHYGYANTAANGWDQWLEEQGVAPNGRVEIPHQQLGFYWRYQRGRVPVLLGGSLNVSPLRNAHPMLLEGLLQVGYALVYQERLSIIVLQGIGLGETQVRFRGRLPESLREAARNYTADAYVRSNFGTWRTAIAFEYAFFDIRREKRSSPIISAQIGFQRFFNQSEWAYGERLPSRDNRFFGKPVDLPRFLTRHFFGVLGIHWMFGL